MVAEVRAAVADMAWLRPSDQAMVELALRYAAGIDAADAAVPLALEVLNGAAPEEKQAALASLLTAQADAVKAAGWLGQQLANVLRSLGGTPPDRKALGVTEGPRGQLAKLREGARKRNSAHLDSPAS
jgi:hypothetical protein